MANTNEGENAMSGGLLVVLGILVAVGLAVYFVPRMNDSSPGDTNVSLNVPSTTRSAEPAAGGNTGTTGNTGTDSNY